MSLRDAEGVGFFGKAFLAFFNPAPDKSSWFGPASSWTQRKPQPSPPDAYAPPIVRERREWPHQSWPGGGQRGRGHQERPYQPWPGGDRR